MIFIFSISEAIEFNKSLEELLVFGKKLTAFYYEDRYPPGPVPEVSEKEAEEMLNSAERIINKIKTDTGL